MTNLDKAVEAILSRYSILGTIRARAAAHALEEAGLLMPDLPKPDSHDEGNIYWIEGTFQVGVSGKFGKMQVTFAESEPGEVLCTDIESARNYALKILAACEYAEKEQNNE